MLKSILAVTLSCSDLDAVERAYVDWLGYEVIERSVIDEPNARALGAAAISGSTCIILQPASRTETFLRVIQRPAVPGYRSLHHHGWNANEILVQDPHSLAARFSAVDSPFRVVGPPAPLDSSPSVVAMQAIGPAGELNYFTRIPPGGGTFIKTSAATPIDRTFIVVLGGAALEPMQNFYRSLGVQVTAAYPAEVRLLQEAYGLPRESRTPTALATLSPAALIELDEMPDGALPRPRALDDLPAGFALMSFLVDTLDSLPVNWTVPPSLQHGALYQGRRAGIVCGAAGEWLELVESIDK